jgi:hypothetical protein
MATLMKLRLRGSGIGMLGRREEPPLVSWMRDGLRIRRLAERLRAGAPEPVLVDMPTFHGPEPETR